MKEMTASSQKYPITSETHSLIMSSKAKDIPQAAEPSFEQSASGDTESIDTRIVYGENAPAYKVLQDDNLLVTKYRRQSFEDIFEECDLTPNSSHSKNFDMRMKYGVYWTPGCGFLLYKLWFREVTVPLGHVVCFTDDDENHIFAKPGIHNIQNAFLSQKGSPIALFGNQRNIIEHGDRCVFTVPEGYLGYATDFNIPILLPPGFHSWRSETLRFEKMIRLDGSPVVVVGPYTILTVDEGYFAITTNNGRQVILEGGKCHLLTHRKWKFERFVNMKIQCEDLRQIHVATADNTLMNIDATIVWKIKDINKAAAVMTETIMQSDLSVGSITEDDVGSLSKLRKDIMKQGVGAIARFISQINYEDHMNEIFSESVSFVSGNKSVSSTKSSKEVDNPMFNKERLDEAVNDANEIVYEFGVEITSINLIAAYPADMSVGNGPQGAFKETDARSKVSKVTNNEIEDDQDEYMDILSVDDDHSNTA